MNNSGQSYKAIEYLEKSLKIGRDMLGENHSQYAKTLNILGLCYENLGQYEKALDYY